MGSFQQFREGIFLDRPAYSLHGGEPERLDFSGRRDLSDHGRRGKVILRHSRRNRGTRKPTNRYGSGRCRGLSTPCKTYRGKSANGVDGVFVKHLVEDQVRGFRATMWRLSAGWDSAQAPEFARAYYYRQAHQFNFVIAGDMRITALPGTG